MAKTHWLQNPNKNYLWHWDLPNWEDLILTIASWDWEEVENPKQRTKEIKRVIRFKEDVKPFICNETNANQIMNVLNAKYIEDSVWKKIQLYVSQTKMMKQMVDCVRVRETAPRVAIDNKQAIAKLNDCKTLSELQQIFIGLSHEEKADSEVVTLKDNLKTTLW